MAHIGASDVQGFRAGANRDKGLAWAMDHCPAHSYLFLDGDCVPNPRWLHPHLPLASGEPLITCGGRHDPGHTDPRTLPLEWQGQRFSASMPTDPMVWQSGNDLRDIISHRILWSCNFGMTDVAAAMLRAAGEKVHGTPRMFWPGFDGWWGGEDTGLALLAHLSGIEIRVNGGQPVRHIPHSPTAMNVRNLDRVQEYGDLCAKKLGKTVSFP